MLGFWRLWDTYLGSVGMEPCRNERGQANFENQCAIRMGTTLAKLNVSLQGTRRCWFKNHVGHVLAAEELGRWMDERPRLFGKTLKFDKGQEPGKEALEYVQGKTGIVLCCNFWGPGGSGDHIDLWNRSQMTRGAHHDYFTRSKKVWFWERR